MASIYDDLLREATTLARPNSGLVTSNIGRLASNVGRGNPTYNKLKQIDDDFWSSKRSVADPYAGLPWYKRLGAKALTSPVGKGLITTAGVIGYPMRTVLATAQEMAEADPNTTMGKLTSSLGVTGTNPLAGLALNLRNMSNLYESSDWVPEGRQSTLNRSWTDRVNDFTYGFGDVYADVSGGGFTGRGGVEDGYWTSGRRWADRLIGLGGEVALDPTVGIGTGTKAIGVGERLVLAAKADRLGMGVEKVAEIAQRGLTRLSDAELAQLGKPKAGLTFFGETIPGTGGASRAVGEAMSGTRNAVTSSKTWQRISRAAPEGQERAYRVLRTGQAEGNYGVLDAIDDFRYNNTLAQSERALAGEFGQEIKFFDKAVKGADEATRARKTHVYEKNAGNMWEALKFERGLDSKLDAQSAGRLIAQFDQQLPEWRTVSGFYNGIYEKFGEAGGKLGRIENFVNHVSTKQAWDFMRGGSEDAKEVVKFFKVDVTSPTGMMLKREWKDGDKIFIKGKFHTLREGTIDEINTLFQKELGFKMFEDDLSKLMVTYLQDSSRGFGILKAVNSLTQGGGGARNSRLADLATEEIDRFAMESGNREVIAALMEQRAKAEAVAKGGMEYSRQAAEEIADDLLKVYTKQIAAAVRDLNGPKGREARRMVEGLNDMLADGRAKMRTLSAKDKKGLTRAFRDLRKETQDDLKRLYDELKSVQDELGAARVRAQSASTPSLAEFNALVARQSELHSLIREAAVADDRAKFLEGAIADMDLSITEILNNMNDPEFVRAMAQGNVPDEIERRMVKMVNDIEGVDPPDVDVDNLGEALDAASDPGTALGTVSMSAREAKIHHDRVQDTIDKIDELLKYRVEDLDASAAGVVLQSGKVLDENVENLSRALKNARGRASYSLKRADEKATDIVRSTLDGESTRLQAKVDSALTEFQKTGAPEAEAKFFEAMAELDSVTEMLRYFDSGVALSADEVLVRDALISEVVNSARIKTTGPDTGTAEGLARELGVWQNRYLRRASEKRNWVEDATKKIRQELDAQTTLIGKQSYIQYQIAQNRSAYDIAKGKWMHAKLVAEGGQLSDEQIRRAETLFETVKKEYFDIPEEMLQGKSPEEIKQIKSRFELENEARRAEGKPTINYPAFMRQLKKASQRQVREGDLLRNARALAAQIDESVELHREARLIAEQLQAANRDVREAAENAGVMVDSFGTVKVNESLARFNTKQARERLDAISKRIDEIDRSFSRVLEDADPALREVVASLDAHIKNFNEVKMLEDSLSSAKAAKRRGTNNRAELKTRKRELENLRDMYKARMERGMTPAQSSVRFEMQEVVVPGAELRPLSQINSELEQLAQAVPIGAGGEAVAKSRFGGDVQKAIDRQPLPAFTAAHLSNGQVLAGGYLVPMASDGAEVVAAEEVRRLTAELEGVVESLSRRGNASPADVQRWVQRKSDLEDQITVAKAQAKNPNMVPIVGKEVFDIAPPEIRQAYLELSRDALTAEDLKGLSAGTFEVDGLEASRTRVQEALAPFADDLEKGRAQLFVDSRSRQVTLRFSNIKSKTDAEIARSFDDLMSDVRLDALYTDFERVHDSISTGLVFDGEQSIAPAVYGSLLAGASTQQARVDKASRLLDFMVRYHDAVKAGATPSPELANRVAEETLNRLQKRLSTEYSRMSEGLGYGKINFDTAAGVTDGGLARSQRVRRRMRLDEERQLGQQQADDIRLAERRANDPEFAADEAELNELVKNERFAKTQKQRKEMRKRINELQKKHELPVTSWRKKSKAALTLDELTKEQFHGDILDAMERVETVHDELKEIDRALKEFGKQTKKGQPKFRKADSWESLNYKSKLKRKEGESQDEFLGRLIEDWREKRLRSDAPTSEKVKAGGFTDPEYMEYWVSRSRGRWNHVSDAAPDSEYAMMSAVKARLRADLYDSREELIQTVWALTGRSVDSGAFLQGGTAKGKFFRELWGKNPELRKALKAKGYKYDSWAATKSMIDQLFENRTPAARARMEARVRQQFDDMGEGIETLAQIRQGLGVKSGEGPDGLVRLDWRDALLTFDQAEILAKPLMRERSYYDDALGVLRGELAEVQARKAEAVAELTDQRAIAARRPELEQQLSETPTVAGARQERLADRQQAMDDIARLEDKSVELTEQIESTFNSFGSIDRDAQAQIEDLDVLLEQQKLLQEGFAAFAKGLGTRVEDLKKGKAALAKVDAAGDENFGKVLESLEKAYKDPNIDPAALVALDLESRAMRIHQTMSEDAASIAEIDKRLDDAYTRLANGDDLVAPIYTKALKKEIRDKLNILGEGLLDDESMVAVSDELFRQLTNVTKSIDNGDIYKVWSASLRYFKRWATARPGFAFRNFQSASFMNFSDGVTLADHKDAFQLWTGMAKGGKKYFDSLSAQEKLAFEMAWGSGTAGRFTAAEVGFQGKKTLTKYLVDNPYLRKMQQLGASSEGVVRLAMALNSARRGDDILEGVARITRIHFDYEQLGKFDRYAKQIIPFWVFMSKNAPMQIEQMMLKPKAYIAYGRFVNAADSTEEGDILPKWITDKMGFKTSDGLMLQPDLGFTQLSEDISMLANPLNGRILSTMAPMAKVPLQIAAKRDFYFNRDTSYQSAGQRAADAFSDFNPQFRDFQRLLPGVADTLGVGNDRYAGREQQSWLSWFGVPVKQVGEAQIQAELRRRAREG